MIQHLPIRLNQTNTASWGFSFLFAVLTWFASTLPAPAQEPLLGLTAANDLRVFSSAAPGTILRTVTVTGLQPGESLAGIDFRPSTGELYAIGRIGGSHRLYRLNTTSGAATSVAAMPYSTTLTGSFFGIDFTPVVDRIRVVSNLRENMRIIPDTGALAGNDTELTVGASVVALAYTNNVAGSTSTTLYGIDSTANQLVQQGGVDGVPSPNGGAISVIGVLGVDTSDDVGFDITPGSIPLASLTVAGVSGLYQIDLANGAATLIGTIGGTSPIKGLAAAIPPEFSISDVTVTEGNAGATSADFSVTLSHPGIINISVDYTATGSTATGGTDFAATSGTVVFAPGETSKAISILVTGDNAVESDETFVVNLSNPVNASLSDAQGNGTIANDDVAIMGAPACGACAPGTMSIAGFVGPAILVSWRRRNSGRRIPRTG